MVFIVKHENLCCAYELFRRSESLLLMREVAFAEQMTEGEKTGKKTLPPSLEQALDSPRCTHCR